MTDDYSNKIAIGQQYIKGDFLEKHEPVTKGYYYKLKKKKTFFFHKSVVYPFVQFKQAKKGLFVTNEEHVEVLNYVERTGYSCLLLTSCVLSLFF